MTDASAEVQSLVTGGAVSPEEANELLSAMGKQPRPAWVSWIINPFEKLSTTAGLTGSVTIAAAGFALSTVGVRFDGALDVHMGSASVGWTTALLDSFVAWPFLALTLFVASAVAGCRGRIVDFVVAVGISRLPLVLVGAAGWALTPDPGLAVQRAMQGHLDPLFLAVALLALPGLIWFLVWLFFGFRTASGARGGRLAVSFVAALVFAEICSKAILWVAL